MDSNNLNSTEPNNEAAASSAVPESGSQKKGSGKVLFLVIGLVIGVVFTLILAGCFGAINSSKKAVGKIEGAGYESPEEAVEAYVNYLKEGNLEGVISTFAVESYVDNYDMTEYYEYIRSFYTYMANGGQVASGFYFDSDMSRELNIESRRAYIFSGLHRQLLQLVFQNTDEEEIADGVRSGMTYSYDEAQTAEDIMSFLSTDPELDSIEIGDFLDVKDFDLNDSKPIKMALKNQKKCWGSDVEPVMLELEIADEDYTIFMLCVCYDERWYIADFNNVVGQSLGVGPSKGLEPDENLHK